MFWRADYTTDLGKTYYQITLLGEGDLLPEVYKNSAVKGRGFCTLPRNVKPRTAVLTDTEGLNYQVEYPFRPGTPEWIQFWGSIRSNPLIITSSGNGEIVKGIK